MFPAITSLSRTSILLDRFFRLLACCLLGASALGHAWAASGLEDDLSRIFVGRSFTIRNFYRGNHLRYESNGELLDRAEPGYWSRDGMVEFTSVKISPDGALTLEGNRTCVLLDQEQGEFSNVTTGDHVQIEIQLAPDRRNLQTVLPVMQRVLLSSRDRLSDLVPAYWRNCVSQKVERRDKHSPWECVVADKRAVPDFEGKKITWDIPLPDTSVHTRTRHYLIRHRVEYLSEQGVKDPSLGANRDPIFEWAQNRSHLGSVKLVLAFTVSEDGQPRDILIVSPVGMGIDDDAVEAIRDWRFTPGMLGDKPHAVHARVIFDIESTNPLQH